MADPLNQPISRRKFLYATGATAAAGLVAACAPAASTVAPSTPGASSAPPSAPTTPPKAVNLAFDSNTGPNAERYKPAVQVWNETQTSSVVTLNTPSPDDNAYKANFPQIAASSDKPDLAWYWVGGGGRFSSMAKNGLLEPLDDLYASEGWDKAYPQQTLDLYKSPDGHYYAVPDTFVFHTPIYYDKALFAKLGIEAPAMPTPWHKSVDEFYAMCDKIRASGIEAVSIAGKDAWPLAIMKDDLTQRLVPSEVQVDLINAAVAGGVPKFHFSDPRFVAGEQAFVDYGTKKVFAKGTLGRAFSDAHAYFVAGKSAMLSDGSWAAGSGLLPTLAPKMDIGWFMHPQLDPTIAPKILTYAGNALMVMAGGKNVEAAKEFLRFLVSKDQQNMVAAQGVLIPARTDVDVEQFKKGNTPLMVDMFAALNIVGTFGPWGDYGPAEPVQLDYVQSQKLLDGTLTPAESAAALDAVCDKIRAGE
jgi:ABC-type glycerol-3-phosphate transport system substrate-binding protein